MNLYNIKVTHTEEITHSKFPMSEFYLVRRGIEQNGFMWISEKNIVIDIDFHFNPSEVDFHMGFINSEFQSYVIKLKRELSLNKILDN